MWPEGNRISVQNIFLNRIWIKFAGIIKSILQFLHGKCDLEWCHSLSKYNLFKISETFPLTYRLQNQKFTEYNFRTSVDYS